MLRLKYDRVIFLLLVVGLIIDTINAILMKYTGEYNKISLTFRLIAELTFLIILFKKGNTVVFKYLFFFFGINISGMILLLPGSDITASEIGKNLIIVNKNIYYFILLSVILLYQQELKKKLYSTINVMYLAIIISIYLGVILKIELFETYSQEIRFGYKGIIVTQNEAVGIILIGLIYYIINYLETRNIYYLLLAIAIYIAGLFTGTKGSIIFLTMAFIPLFIRYSLKNKRVLIYSLIIIPFLYLYDWKKLSSLYNNSIAYTSSFYYKTGDIVFTVLSGRNLRLKSLYDASQTDTYNLYHYLFGGMNFSRLGTEMDLFDLFTLFGIIGTGIFYYLYISSFFAVTGKSGILSYFIILFIAASTLGGHLIYNAVIPIYLITMLLKIRDYNIANGIGT